ncbi:hypothetical protein T439DRAFT_379182 [Meredithblackwellia eburnea MCA 4105]
MAQQAHHRKELGRIVIPQQQSDTNNNNNNTNSNNEEDSPSYSTGSLSLAARLPIPTIQQRRTASNLDSPRESLSPRFSSNSYFQQTTTSPSPSDDAAHTGAGAGAAGGAVGGPSTANQSPQSIGEQDYIYNNNNHYYQQQQQQQQQQHSHHHHLGLANSAAASSSSSSRTRGGGGGASPTMTGPPSPLLPSSSSSSSNNNSQSREEGAINRRAAGGGGAGSSHLLPSFGIAPLSSIISSSNASNTLSGSTSKDPRLKASSARRWVSRLVQGRHHLHRNRLLLLVFVVTLLGWVLLGKGRTSPVVREKLMTRWWEEDSSGNAPSLLPRPSMIPKPPRPKPLSLTSHSLEQLSRLSTKFSNTSPPDYTALIHVSSSSQLSQLPKLVRSVLKQQNAPQRTIILAPEGLSPSTGTMEKFGPSVSLIPYPPTQPPALAIVLLSSSTIATDFVLVIDGNVDSIRSSYARTMLKLALTKEYRHALLSAGGLVLPVSSSSRLSTCRVADGKMDRTAAIHAPSTPFLVGTRSLAAPSISNGLRTDVPLEVSLALALWTKEGVPSFGIPVPSEEGKRDWGCERLRRAVGGRESRLGPLFRRDPRPSSLRESVVRGGAGEGEGEGEGEQQQQQRAEGEMMLEKDGTVVLLLSGDAELELAHPLACGFAQEHDVRVFVSDSESAAQGPHVFFPSSSSSSATYRDFDSPGGGGVGSDGARCHLDIHPIGTGSSGESIQLLVVEEFDKVDKIEVVLYAMDGDRGREFGEVLKWSEAVFGVKMGGRRRGRKKVDAEGGTVVVPLTKADLVQAEWISALPIESLRHWHTPKIDVTVVTNNRPASLFRLLTALQDAHYFTDEVSLSLNLEQTADRVTQRLVDDFQWHFGTVTLRHRIVLGGLMPAIVESWYPASNDTYGVFLEDDVEVSPMFYAWLKFTILYYRYYTPMRERSQRLFGVSLYQQRNNELDLLKGRVPFDAHKIFEAMSIPPTLPYLSQVPCSWGAVYFPEVWREFHSYLALRLSEMALSISESIVPEIRSNKWRTSWKKYFIELVYMRGYVMLYPNYADFVSFSNNHLEKGTHIHISVVDEKRKRQFDVPLMGRNGSILDLPEGRLPHWDALPVVDLWGAVASDEDLVERGWQSVAQLDTCATPFRLDILPTYNARELLCAKEYTRTNDLVAAQPLAVKPAAVEVELPAKGVADAGEGDGGQDVDQQRALPRDLDEVEILREVKKPPGEIKKKRSLVERSEVEDDSLQVRKRRRRDAEEEEDVQVVAEVPAAEE